MSLASKQHCVRHYQWSDGCDGWVLAETPGLSVKQERMPANTAEALHFHNNAQQFFFIICGTASFEVDGQLFTINSGEGIHIAAGKKHRIINNTEADLEFILSSQPSADNDRVQL